MKTKKAYPRTTERPVKLEQVTLQIDPTMASFDEATGRLVLALPARDHDRRLIPMLEDSFAHAQLSSSDQGILLNDTLIKIRELQVMAFLRDCYVDGK